MCRWACPIGGETLIWVMLGMPVLFPSLVFSSPLSHLPPPQPSYSCLFLDPSAALFPQRLLIPPSFLRLDTKADRSSPSAFCTVRSPNAVYVPRSPLFPQPPDRDGRMRQISRLPLRASHPLRRGQRRLGGCIPPWALLGV
ncbi:hypothetical protein B0H14DRAFT_1373420 [Mycena olivaceomarginata]|nr:hypothetical protein B0H14DRAFT_1373420 [Mycena olivaceomarginata]